MLIRCIAVLVLVAPAFAQEPERARKEMAAIQQEITGLQDRLANLEATIIARSPHPPDSAAVRTQLDDTGTRQQCTATTKKGTRCSRLAAVGNSRCWQH